MMSYQQCLASVGASLIDVVLPIYEIVLPDGTVYHVVTNSSRDEQLKQNPGAYAVRTGWEYTQA